MRKTVLTVTTAVFVGLLPAAALAGGGGGGDISACSGFAEGSEIVMLDSCFEGVAHLAPRGSTLVVRNDGALPHTFTAVDGSFDTGQLEAGEAYELTVDEPGVYQVFCTLHGTASGDGMAGVLIAGEPEELVITAPPSLDLLAEAVAEGNQGLTGAIESQGAMIAAFTSSFAKLTEAMEEPAPAEAAEPVEAPASSAPTDPDTGWAMAMASAALALGLVAVANSLVDSRDRGRDPTPMVGLPQLDA